MNESMQGRELRSYTCVVLLCRLLRTPTMLGPTVVSNLNFCTALNIFVYADQSEGLVQMAMSS
jgi:hypothetical protein